jgi:two-component system chemotaxis response regulator CheY
MTDSGARKLIVVLEDSSDCAETLQIALEALRNTEIRVCDSALSLWQIPDADFARIAAVVTDLHLTRSDGFDVIRRLRADARFSTIPILLISGDSDPRLPALAISCGASAWFAKPYSPAAVRRKLEELMC